MPFRALVGFIGFLFLIMQVTIYRDELKDYRQGTLLSKFAGFYWPSPIVFVTSGIFVGDFPIITLIGVSYYLTATITYPIAAIYYCTK